MRTQCVVAITAAAAERLGHREQLVGPVIDVITRKHFALTEPSEIVAELRSVFTDTAPQAQPDFVTWVTDQLDCRFCGSPEHTGTAHVWDQEVHL